MQYGGNACRYPIHSVGKAKTVMIGPGKRLRSPFSLHPGKEDCHIFGRGFLGGYGIVFDKMSSAPKECTRLTCVNHFSEHSRHRTDAGIGKQMHHLAMLFGKIFDHQTRTVTVAVDGANNDIGTLQ